MTWKRTELAELVARDVDDVIERARTLTGRDRTAAFRDALRALDVSVKPIERLKTLRFLQMLLAQWDNARLAVSLADPAAHELSRIVMASPETIEARRAALDALALLFLKAKELTPMADSRVRTAFKDARSTDDDQMRELAIQASAPRGVLSRRAVKPRHGVVFVSAVTASAITGGVIAAKTAKQVLAKRKRLGTTTTSRRNTASQ
jgi:hypothetical protein